MSDETVGARGDEFVIGVEAGVDTPLAAEGAGTAPGKKGG
jgi:hypothetical protein